MTLEKDILSGIIAPERGNLSAELARYVLSLGFTPEQHEMVRALSDKAQLGALSEEEQATLDEFLRAEAFLAILKSKARASLREQNSAA